MGTSYRAQVAMAFEVLAEGLAPFVDARMSKVFPDDDWVLMAASKLGKRRDVLVSLSDPHFQLEVMNRWWGPAFASDLPADMRQAITDLRTARNHWAHPDEDHPFDVDYATRVHGTAEELLRSFGSPLADQMLLLSENLRWDVVHDRAAAEGLSESEALMEELAELQHRYSDLQSHLDEEREIARSAAGKTRAVARQLAELQTQYAAVSGLQEEYEQLRSKLNSDESTKEAAADDTSQVRRQLIDAEQTLIRLRSESTMLRDQLRDARTSITTIDPMDTAIGRRWIWLVTVLILLLGILVVVAYYLPK